jgi:NTE family protein
VTLRADASTQRLSLALGGGGARGLAHLGILQVLDREGIAIDRVVGTSIGSLVGAAYALHPDGLELTRRALAYLKGDSFKNNPFKKVLFHSEDVEMNLFRTVIRNIKKSYVFSSLIRKPAIFTSERLYNVICDLIPDRRFEDTQIPFAVPAIDIRSGREVLLNKGPMRKALLASCSLPGFFPPVEHEGMLLMDAGVISPVPVSMCLEGSSKVLVAVDISSSLEQVATVQIGLDAILRVEAIAGRRINELELEKADVVIRPAVGARDWSDFRDLDVLVESGIDAARGALPRIRELMTAKPPRRRFWKTSGTSA